MMQDKPQAKPDAADTARTVSKQAEQPPRESGSDRGRPDPGKPDEGIRPDALTSESDGGSQG